MSDPLKAAIQSERLSQRELHDIDTYWRAANYLTIGQIYLMDNPLLREPLRLEHVKPRLLGHWGTSPGLSFIYAHLNRFCRKTFHRVCNQYGRRRSGLKMSRQIEFPDHG
ncbi:phosphoketolase family protein, partial [Sinorhizobium meliloti]